MLRSILDAMGLLEAPLTNNIKSNFKTENINGRWCNDDRFGTL
jgi:hypothetical protein